MNPASNPSDLPRREIVVHVGAEVMDASTEWCPLCLLPAAERIVVVMTLNDQPTEVVTTQRCECEGGL